MTWLLSYFLAGAMFASGSLPPAQVYETQESIGLNQLDETERQENSYPFSLGGKVEVSNINGSVTVNTWEKPEIKLEVVKIADSKEQLAEMRVEVEAEQESFRVTVDFGNWSGKERTKWRNNGKSVANITLTVPRTAVLDEIHSINGNVTVTNATSFTKASAINGTVRGNNLRGDVKLSAINGTVEADCDQLLPGNVISLSTVNGKARLLLPSDSNATVRAGSLNGEIANDFGLPVRKGEFIGRDLYGRIGSGDAKVKLESVNGQLEIKRKADGRNLNPAVDLLPKKSSGDDFDFEFDNDFDAAMRDSQRELRDGQRELERSRREMERAVRQSTREAQNNVRVDAELSEAMKASIDAMRPEIAKLSEEALKQASAALKVAEAQSRADIAALRAKEVKAVMADERFPWGKPFLEEKRGSFPVKGVPSVTIDATDCSVTVRGWDKSEVGYTMSKVAPNAAQEPTVLNAEQKNPESVEIKVSNPAGDRDSFYSPDGARVQLEVFVPKKSNLKIVTNGEVRLDGVTGDIDLQGVDQPVNVRDSGGNLKLRTDDATVRVIGFTGTLDSRISDGELFIEGDFERIKASAEDGAIFLTVPANTNAKITANTEEIELRGIELIRKESEPGQKNSWLLGKGGRDYDFQLSDGIIVVRGQSELVGIK